MGFVDSGSIDLPKIRHSSAWRLTVWGLRLEGLGLLVMLSGLFVDVLVARSVGISIKVVGLICMAIGILIILVGAFAVYRQLDAGSARSDLSHWLLADVIHPQQQSPI